MLIQLDPATPLEPFPDVETALTDPNGLVAIGGCLSPRRLINAYRHGLFPWFNEGEPILWWSPNPRLVLYPDRLKISRSLAKKIRQRSFKISFDKAFDQVVDYCSQPRSDALGTWITPEMKEAYSRLHLQGHAHSVEAWSDKKLVGGLYGVAIGKVFFGESMFSRVSDASKVAFASLTSRLIEHGFELIDCQIKSDHLVSLGAGEIPRKQFTAMLTKLCSEDPLPGCWQNGTS